MPEEVVPPQDDAIGGAFLVIDQEIDKMVASVSSIMEQLDKLAGEPAAAKIRDIMDHGVAPYIAEVAQVLNDLEEK